MNAERIEDLLADSAARAPRATAVIDGARRLDYSALAQLSTELAAGLARAGACVGDRIAVCAKNRVETIALYFAAAELDAVLVPLNWRLTPRELQWILAHADAKFVFADPGFLPALELGQGRRGFVFDDADVVPESWTPFAELLGEAALRARSGEARQPAVQMYTSGTTGLPKGATLSHANVVAMTSAWLADMPLVGADEQRSGGTQASTESREASRFLQVTPLFHVGGMLMVLAVIGAGSALYLLPEFDPVAVLGTLQRERITHTLMVPAMVEWCLAEHRHAPREFPDLQLIVYGAAPMPERTLTRCREVFRCDLLQGYGLTETAGVLTTLTPRDHHFELGTPPPARLASAGRAVRCAEVRVVDETGADVPALSAEVGRTPGAELAGHVGEVIARGANVMLGYHADPEATNEALTDGWLRTGDLAWIDEEGYVYLVDRKKDMLLVGGENVYPREIEDVLLRHPAIADAAVIGVPHTVWGEEPLAFVVLREGAAGDARVWSRYCREHLARFKCPVRFETVTELPRNSAGKLQKALLREPFWSGLPRRV